MEPQLFILPEVEAGSEADPEADGPADGPAESAAGHPPVEFTPPPRWRLDDRTRAVGRQGIAKARAALRAATQAAAEQDRSAA